MLETTSSLPCSIWMICWPTHLPSQVLCRLWCKQVPFRGLRHGKWCRFSWVKLEQRGSKISSALSKVTYQCLRPAENLLCPPLETSAAVQCCICLRSDKGSHFSHSVCFKRMEDRTMITINTFIAFPSALQGDEMQSLKKELEQTHIALF